LFFFGLLIDFFGKWLDEGRFPREEFRIRWWIALLGVLVVGTLAIALIVAAFE
jgi:hypothetical protein